MMIPMTAVGAPAASTVRSMTGESTLASPTTATSETTSKPKLAHASPVGRRRRVRLGVGRVRDRKEVVAVPRSLDEDEDRPQGKAGRRHEAELGTAVGRIPRTDGEVRQHERQRGHRDQCGEAGTGALDAEALLPIGEAAHQDADADHAVADDHHRGVDRVAREDGRVGTPRQHHREDQRGLDDAHGDGQDQRTEGLADAVGDHLGVVDRGEDRRDEHGSANDFEHQPHPARDRDDEQDDGN